MLSVDNGYDAQEFIESFMDMDIKPNLTQTVAERVKEIYVPNELSRRRTDLYIGYNQ